jgi:membrane-bound acyltransferase YfiQ involved in biofilm formation
MGLSNLGVWSWSLYFEKYFLGGYILHNRERVLGWLEKYWER